MMHIGICCLELYMPSAANLKNRRQIVGSISDRVRHRFNVAISEEPNNDLWQKVRLVFCCVNGDKAYLNGMLSKIVEFIESSRLDANITDESMEIISGF